MGVAVFSGMLGVTFFGLLLTPLFYLLVRKYLRRRKAPAAAAGAAPTAQVAHSH
jgi:multidrug efflux pump